MGSHCTDVQRDRQRLGRWNKPWPALGTATCHVPDGAATRTSSAQAAVAQKLELIDNWGNSVTVVAVVYRVALGGLCVYRSWVQNTGIGV